MKVSQHHDPESTVMEDGRLWLQHLANRSQVIVGQIHHLRRRDCATDLRELVNGAPPYLAVPERLIAQGIVANIVMRFARATSSPDQRVQASITDLFSVRHWPKDFERALEKCADAIAESSASQTIADSSDSIHKSKARPLPRRLVLSAYCADLERRFQTERNEATIFAPATTIFRDGDPAHRVFIVRRGLLKLVRVSGEGREIILGFRSTGWLLGSAPAILAIPYQSDAITISECHLFSVSASQFRKFFEGDLRLSWDLHILHASELASQSDQLASIGVDARQRLSRLLIDLSHDMSGDQAIGWPLRHRDLAAAIGVSAEHLSRLLTIFERDGLIVRRGNTLVITDAEGLKTASSR